MRPHTKEQTNQMQIVPPFQERSGYFRAPIQEISVLDRASLQSFLVVLNLDVHRTEIFEDL